MNKSNVLLTTAAVIATLLASTAAIAQSARSASAAPPPPPPAMTTQPAKAAADMQTVLDPLAVLGSKPVETLTPAQARLNPSATDAAKAAMAAKGMSTAPDPSVSSAPFPA